MSVEEPATDFYKVQLASAVNPSVNEHSPYVGLAVREGFVQAKRKQWKTELENVRQAAKFLLEPNRDIQDPRRFTNHLIHRCLDTNDLDGAELEQREAELLLRLANPRPIEFGSSADYITTVEIEPEFQLEG